MFPSLELSKAMKRLNIQLRRFKTGTPPRVNSDSVDFSRLEKQPGDDSVTPFSFETRKKLKNREICHITYTNEETRRVILDNINRSPLYSHKIEGIGTRYCPSIEDKIVRFSDKKRHQVFIEPCGLYTKELYLQGLSSSLPVDVQDKILKSIPGLENARVMRNAYAIEYDCINPLSLKPTLEFMDKNGLFAAGQYNGTSGYEEAAAQGLVAGINAAHKALKRAPFILPRSSSYIGTLIDDLVTKGCEDPYRMLTSRSEYRLVLRQDNADLRLTEKGYLLGLVNRKRLNEVKRKLSLIEEEIKRTKRTTIAPSGRLNAVLSEHGTAVLETGARLSELIKRPQLGYESLQPFDETRPFLPRDVIEQAEITIKYEGYIKRQQAAIAQAQRLENMKLPEDIDYSTIKGLRLEAAEKLSKIKPENVGQASRISGVSPCDISVLLIFLRKK